MGLVLRLRKGDIIKLNDNIFIEINTVTNKKVGIHIVAPQDVIITSNIKKGEDDERSDSKAITDCV